MSEPPVNTSTQVSDSFIYNLLYDMLHLPTITPSARQLPSSAWQPFPLVLQYQPLVNTCTSLYGDLLLVTLQSLTLLTSQAVCVAQGTSALCA
jgi:hypothetical protein